MSTSFTPDEARGDRSRPAARARGNATANLGRRCTATTKAGEPCPVPPMTGKDRCRMHLAADDPALAARLERERRQGALASLQRRLPASFPAIDFSTSEGIRAVLEAATRALSDQTIPSSTASAIAQVAAVALRTITEDQSRELARIRALLERRGLL